MKRTIEQAFTVPFQYQVCFSKHIFDKRNALLAGLLNNGKRAKVFFVIDEGVLNANPGLLGEIKAYAIAFDKDFILCAEPLVVPGGEQAKNDREYFQIGRAHV